MGGKCPEGGEVWEMSKHSLSDVKRSEKILASGNLCGWLLLKFLFRKLNYNQGLNVVFLLFFLFY